MLYQLPRVQDSGLSGKREILEQLPHGRRGPE